MQPMSCHPKHGRSSSASPAPTGRIHPHTHTFGRAGRATKARITRVEVLSSPLLKDMIVLPCGDRIDTFNTSASPKQTKPPIESKVAETKTLQTISGTQMDILAITHRLHVYITCHFYNLITQHMIPSTHSPYFGFPWCLCNCLGLGGLKGNLANVRTSSQCRLLEKNCHDHAKNKV